MLKPGDICPCCGSRIPETISSENLALLSLIQLEDQFRKGKITPAARMEQLDEILGTVG